MADGIEAASTAQVAEAGPLQLAVRSGVSSVSFAPAFSLRSRERCAFVRRKATTALSPRLRSVESCLDCSLAAVSGV